MKQLIITILIFLSPLLSGQTAETIFIEQINAFRFNPDKSLILKTIEYSNSTVKTGDMSNLITGFFSALYKKDSNYKTEFQSLIPSTIVR